jgi:GABA(A) receptor-associated protein
MKFSEEFKSRPLSLRISESNKVKLKYKDRIPLIVDASFPLTKNKFLVPIYITISEFMYIIRKQCKLQPEKSLFIFINNTIPVGSDLISKIYDEYANEDGFLYVVIKEESVFGSY